MGSPQSRSTPALGISSLSPKERLDLIGGACGTASPLKEVCLTPAQERELDRRIATFEDAKTPIPRESGDRRVCQAEAMNAEGPLD